MPDTTFDRILGRLSEADDAVTEKTASTHTPAPSAEATMLAAVRRVSESAGSTKTASDNSNSPARSLEEMAKTAAAQEEERLIKQAQHMGAVMCDSFFERFAAYDTALEGHMPATKTASADQLKAAREEGYKLAAQQIEAKTQEEFNRGYEDTIQEVYKTAAEIHYHGQVVARQLINEANS